MLSATIIVGAANEWMSRFFYRMLILLDPKNFDAWLSGDDAAETLRPATEDTLQ